MSSVLETVSIGAFYPLLNNALALDGGSVSAGGRVLEYLSAAVKVLPIREEIIAASVFLLIAVLASTVFGFFADSLATWYRYKLLAEFLNGIYQKFLNNQYRFFLEKKQGDLLYVGLNASHSVGEMLLYFPKIGVEFFRIFTISIFLLTISAQVTFAVFGVVALFWAVVHYLSVKVIHPVAVELQDAQSEMTSVFSESMAGIRQIKIFDNPGFWFRRFSLQTQRTQKLSTKNMVFSYVPARLIIVLSVAAIVFSIVYVKLYTPDQFKTFLPVIGVYMIAIQRIMPSISNIGHHWMGLKSLAPRLDVTYNTLNDRTFDTKDAGTEYRRFEDRIVLQNVSFSYPDRKDVLRNIDLSIKKGQTIAIVGESGAGKSTLVDLLIRLYEPVSGRIIIDGTDYLDFSRSSWLMHVGMVTQDTFIFHASVKENIRVGNPEATEPEIIEAARVAHAHDFIMEMPEGYDTIVGDRGVKLSGGQRQRIAIARAAIRKPDILILDEATSALDNISEKVVQEALKEMTAGKTTIMIAHRLSTIEYADNIVVMRMGEVIEQGAHEELLGAGGYYYSLYSKQNELSANQAFKKEGSTDVPK